MSEDNKSHRQILKSSSIIGGASVINILIGLFKIKVVALLLGPAGIGLIGLLQNVMAMTSSVAAMGIGTAGTRQVAEANAEDDQQAITTARRALLLGAMLLAILGGLLVWMFREQLAIHLLDDGSKSAWVGWLALGVVLSVASESQTALLNGMRKIVELAKVRIYSALLATILGIAALWILQERGLAFFVISVPIATFVLGHVYVSRLPKITVEHTPVSALKKQWKALLQLGFAFMVAGLAVTLGQLAVRTLVQNKLGSVELGLFQAAWTVSMTYIGFVLVAMGADYYPRLTGVIKDQTATIRLVNEQTEIALLLAGPVFLSMLTLAPWVLTLLYSSDFVSAAQILRWQILGDILKVISWPVGFIVLASSASKTFLLFESIVMLVFYTFTWLTIDYLGIEATGIGFFVMYLIYLPIVYLWARYKINFRWTKRNVVDSSFLFFSAVLISFLSLYSEKYAFILGLLLTVLHFKFSFDRLNKMNGNNAILKKMRKIIGK